MSHANVDMKTAGNRMKMRRKLLGLSQGDVAEAVGVSITAICKYEAGGGTRLALSFADALQTTVRWLETGEDAATDEQGNLLVADAPPIISPRRIERRNQGGATPNSLRAQQSELLSHLLAVGLSPIQMAAVDQLVQGMKNGEIDDTLSMELYSKFRLGRNGDANLNSSQGNRHAC